MTDRWLDHSPGQTVNRRDIPTTAAGRRQPIPARGRPLIRHRTACSAFACPGSLPTMSGNHSGARPALADQAPDLVFQLSGWRDLNPRPLRPERDHAPTRHVLRWTGPAFSLSPSSVTVQTSSAMSAVFGPPFGPQCKAGKRAVRARRAGSPDLDRSGRFSLHRRVRAELQRRPPAGRPAYTGRAAWGASTACGRFACRRPPAGRVRSACDYTPTSALLLVDEAASGARLLDRAEHRLLKVTNTRPCWCSRYYAPSLRCTYGDGA